MYKNKIKIEKMVHEELKGKKFPRILFLEYLIRKTQEINDAAQELGKKHEEESEKIREDINTVTRKKA